MLEIADRSELTGRSPDKICPRCKKTTKEILEDRPNLSKVFWRKGICDPCFHKLKRKCRNKLIEKDSRFGKGFRIEMVISKTLRLKNCNIELDNFNSISDLYDPVKYKDIQVKSVQSSIRKASWNDKIYEYDVWHFPISLPEYDTYFAVCMSKDYQDIERIYTIPTEKLPMSAGLTIYKIPVNRSWHEDYRIDERQYNEIYHSINIDDCPVIKKELSA
jgi:hypothetical protein